MTARTRTRSRNTPATQEEVTEARNSGVPASERVRTRHKPVTSTEVVHSEGGLVAYVRVTNGVTLNMTDYNSFRRDVGVELPVKLGDNVDVLDSDGRLSLDVRNQLDRVYEALSGWIEEKHEETVAEASEFFEG